LAATSGFLQSFRGYGNLGFANVTFGNRLNNITFAGGYFMYRGGGQQNYNQVYGPIIDDQSYVSFNAPMGLPKPVQGPMFSVGGVARIGAKASFVFDSMLGLFQQRIYEEVTTTIVPVTYDPEYIPGLFSHEIVERTYNSSALFIMPGMRFQRDERRAFQFNLAGMVVSESGESFSVPFPMCTWFYRF
jgi:hypothetical protein